MSVSAHALRRLPLFEIKNRGTSMAALAGESGVK